MIPQPLHPAIAHFPIVLMVLLPIAAITALVLTQRGAELGRTWLPVVILAFALSGSSWVAVETGEREEEVVEEVVAESAIHDHEEEAELFMALTVVALVLAGAGLLKGLPGKVARPLAILTAVILLGLGYRVGHTGGELVYVHGAANAYVTNSDERVRDDSDEREREDRDGTDEEEDRR